MNNRLCLLCRWTILNLSNPGLPKLLTIIVPTKAAGASNYNAFFHWHLNDMEYLVREWLQETFVWVVNGHSHLSMYGSPLTLPAGIDKLVTLPVLVTTLDNRLETAFCGYHIVGGDNMHSGYGCRAFLPTFGAFNEAIKICFANRTPDNSLYVDYSTKYSLDTGNPVHEAAITSNPQLAYEYIKL